MPEKLPPLAPIDTRGRILVAFSGGPDSVCLLHLLAARHERAQLLAVHVDHGLDPESVVRAERARTLTARMGIDCRVLRVTVEARDGVEADARRARYAALAACMEVGDALVTAHHADDQAETILLRSIRGAGVTGLGGMARQRAFGPGALLRPLLAWRRRDILHHLEAHGLEWIDDPANELPHFDRNYLRQDILPRIESRWPGAVESLNRSARLCRGAAACIERQVARDLERAAGTDDDLDLDRLADDSYFYTAEVLRHWCLAQGLAPPDGRPLDAFVSQLHSAGPDRQPELATGDARIRFWRGRLWIDPEPPDDRDWALDWNGSGALALPARLGRLVLKGEAQGDLELLVRSGRPGERLRLEPGGGRRAVKQLLAEAGVPPWRRERWPRLWLEGRLVAVGERFIDADFARLLAERGQRLVWQPASPPGPDRVG